MIETVLVMLNYKEYDNVISFHKRCVDSNIIKKIIIVDGGSQDGSYERLKELQDQKTDVILANGGVNRGYSSGYNCGFTTARELYHPEYIILSNPDVIFSDELLSVCLDYLRKDKSCGAVSCRQKGVDDSERSSAWAFPSFSNDLKWCFGLWRRFVAPGFYNKRKLSTEKDEQVVDSLSGSFTVYRSKAFFDSGMFDENVFLYNEENIIGKRMRVNGWHLVRLNRHFYIHNHVKKTKSNPTYKELIRMLSSGWYLHKNYNDIGVFPLFVYKLAIYWYALEVRMKNLIRIIWRGKKR